MTAPAAWLQAVAECLYRAALLAYPRSFRHVYGRAMTQTFRARCRTALLSQGSAALLRVCAAELGDLIVSASREHGDELRRLVMSKRRSTTMATHGFARQSPPRLWGAGAATIAGGLVAVLASLNLYLLEDGNPLTQAAYRASPLLRFSYDGLYLSALVAGVTLCAIVGYTVAPDGTPVAGGLAVVTLLVALGGFGGLLARHPSTFLALLMAFAGLALLSALGGWAVAARARRGLERRPAAILGACVSASLTLLVNAVLLIAHTLALNPASHLLYLQGQIGGTRANALLVAMAVELLALGACALSVGLALRRILPARPNGGAGSSL